jgi:hypothetical protein
MQLKSTFDWRLGADEHSALSSPGLLDEVRRYKAALELIAGLPEREAATIARKALAGR